MGTDGPLNQALLSMNMVESAVKFWQEPSWFWLLVTIIRAWKEVGWDTIIYMAALAGIDPGLYEAAEIDGANRWRKIWHITLPGIRSTILIMLILEIGRVMTTGASFD